MSVVSLGPGDPKYLPPRARETLCRSRTVVGYKTYIELLEPELLQGKEIISTGMTKEIDRCTRAIQQAKAGKDTCIVCSGDAGIYAMAGLVYELLSEQEGSTDIRVDVIPGIPALCAAASLLGAPVMQDFACISLSDLLISWERIEKRLQAAAIADFVLILYNPRSKKRDWQLQETVNILQKHLDTETPVGIVRNACRSGEWVKVSTLAEFDPQEVDMLSIVIVGNSQTRILEGKMVTSRGYLEKYA